MSRPSDPGDPGEARGLGGDVTVAAHRHLEVTAGGAGPHRVDRVTAEQLEVAAWDQLALSRAQFLDAGEDISYDRVLVPALLGLLGPDPGRVLDAGCGVGRATARIAEVAREVVAVDPSVRSARLAAAHLATLGNVEVRCGDVASAASRDAGSFDVCVALMVLQDVTDLDAFLDAAFRALRPGGRLVAVVTHPTGYPRYRGYAEADWFDPEEEVAVVAEFITTRGATGVDTLHVHRPWNTYLTSLRYAGFTDVHTSEPTLSARDGAEVGITWSEPHFLAFTAHRP